jgi:hypothetical protein
VFVLSQEDFMDRAKFQTTAEAAETKDQAEKNPRNHFRSKHARSKGLSGKGEVREAKKKHSRRA